jgi:hypothetical protein
MEHPNVLNKFIDTKNNVTYEIWAYRKLTQTEIRTAVRVHLSKRRALPKKGRLIKICSLIGHND